MTKQEYKKAYRQYRTAQRDFQVELQTSNWPCGYDDMKCEQFDDHRNKWLDENPVIKAVVNNWDNDDHLVQRQYAYYLNLKSAIQYRMAS